MCGDIDFVNGVVVGAGSGSGVEFSTSMVGGSYLVVVEYIVYYYCGRELGTC